MVLVDEAKGLVGDGVQVHQLLCGREIAKAMKTNLVDRFAYQMANYVYLVVDEREKKAVAIDPAWDVQSLLEICASMGCSLEATLYTHEHFDHTGGKVPKAMTGIDDVVIPGVIDFVESSTPVYIGKKDAKTVAKQCAVPIKSLNQIDEGDSINITNGLNFNVLATPGHTPGSVCFQLGKVLFTGDTLFIGSCGRVDLPNSNPQQMLSSLHRLSQLPEESLVLPGHNYALPAHSTISMETNTNHMMMQAIDRNKTSKQGNGVKSEPVAAFLPLPDYLGVARRVLDENSSHACLNTNAQQLESHF